MDVSLTAVYAKFPSRGDCVRYLESLRWADGPRCPHCNSERQTPLVSESRYHCNGCNTNYSVTAKTVFKGTRVDLQKWFLMIAYMINRKRGPSARKLAVIIKVNKNTACYMAMRVRHELPKDINFFLTIADEVTK
jgi:transposase-like protein